jgi:hypothetical protein
MNRIHTRVASLAWVFERRKFSLLGRMRELTDIVALGSATEEVARVVVLDGISAMAWERI